MFRNISAWHLIIVLVVVLLLFGANRLPGLAKSIGQSMKIFKNEVKDLTDDGGDTPAAGASPGTGSGATTVGTTTDVPPPPAPPATPPAPPRP